jgi:AraC family transcriptional regulator
MPEVRIAEFPHTRVAVLTHQGSAQALAETIQRFITWRRRVGLPPDRAATFTILHSSPAEGDFRHDVCLATDEPIESNPEGVVEGVLPAARCAVVRLESTDAVLGATLDWLHREWLPANGEARADLPPFAHRISFTQGEQKGVTDLYLPLA